MATRQLSREAPRDLERRPQRRKPKPVRLRVVQGSKADRRRSSLAVVVLIMLMVFGVAILQAWVGQEGLRAATLEREVQHEQERLTLQRARVAQLSSAQRLRAEAVKLGLVPATDPTYLQVPVEPVGSALPRTPTKSLESPSP